MTDAIDPYDFSLTTDDVRTSHTPPPALYTDPAVFAREREVLFGRQWVAVARADALKPGTYRTFDLAGDPIVVTRDRGGELHAFSNVCLHRACPIAADGGGVAPGGVLTCPYHLWTYELDGRLRGAPHMKQAEGFASDRMRLPALRVEQWLGWVFVNGDADAAPLAPQLDALHTQLAPFGVERMCVAGSLRYDSRWNWKILVENFMESYHHIGPHAGTLNPTHPAAGTHAVDLPGAFALLENPSAGPDHAPFWVACVFPSTLIFVSRGTPPLAIWYEIQPHAVDHFTLDVHLLAAPEFAGVPAFVEQVLAVTDAVHREDIAICEAVWRGVHSRHAVRGRLSVLEAAVHRFHRYLRERLAAD